MNIFKFEFKNLYKQSIIWLISICSVFGLFVSMYPTYSDNEKAVTQVFASYPKAMLSALGVDLQTIFSFNGFYSFCLNYLLLVVAIMALYFSLSVFGREKKTKTGDFLFTNPVSRSTIFISKFSASFLALMVVNVGYLIFGIFMFKTVGENNGNFNHFILITCSLFLVEIIFYSFGIFLSTVLKKIKNAGGLANSTGFIFFIISMVAGIIVEKWLNYITPFKYFNPNYIMANGHYELNYLIISLILITGFIAAAYYRYLKTDIDNI